jgi:hypothetical protein
MIPQSNGIFRVDVPPFLSLESWVFPSQATEKLKQEVINDAAREKFLTL